MTDRDPNDPIYAKVLEAMSHLDVTYTGDKTDQPVADMACPNCSEAGHVRYTGTEVLEGSLEWRHLVHTEVDHHLRCTACSHEWTVFRML